MVWSFGFCCISESKRPTNSKVTEPQQDSDDLTVLKSLADGQKTQENSEATTKKDVQYVPDESDSTKSRRLVEDYDSTKNGMDYGKYQGRHTCPGSVRKGAVVDGYVGTASACHWLATRQTF